MTQFKEQRRRALPKVQAYHNLSSSDKQQAKQEFSRFLEEAGVDLGGIYTDVKPITEVTGSALARLLNNCNNHDIILTQSTTVFDGLSNQGWQEIATIVANKGLRVVVIDIPMTWQQLEQAGLGVTNKREDFEYESAITTLLIETLASVARSAQKKRKQLQAKGIKKAQQEGKYEGRKPNIDLYKDIIKSVEAGMTYKEIVEKLGCSSRTIARAKKWGRLNSNKK